MHTLQTHSAEMKKAWNQNKVPIVLRRTEKGQKLRIRLPFLSRHRSVFQDQGWLRDRQWLSRCGKSDPIWDDEGRFWEVPKSWFNKVVNYALEDFKSIYIVQPYRAQEKCSPSCLDAIGHECECSCMGMNHGAGNDGSWFEVHEAFALKWGKAELACRLLISKQPC